MPQKLATIILLLLAPLFLTACSLADLPLIGGLFGGVTSGPVELKVWGLWEKSDVMAVLVQKYQEAHPNVTVVYEDRSIMKLADYKERVFLRDENGGPDVLMVHNSWVKRLSPSLTPMPSTYMDSQTYAKTFYPVATESAVFNGKIYAMPFNYDGLVLVYNTDHFAAVGQSLPPTAWEEFRRLAIKLTIHGGESGNTLIRSGAAMGSADNIEHFSDIIGLMWSQAGVSIPGDLETSAARDALDFYLNFSREDKIWDASMPEATDAFAQGLTSMIFVPSWRVLDIINASPNLRIGVAPVPQALPDNPSTWASFWMYTVPSSSKNSAVAWDFVNFIAQDENQLMLYDSASKVRTFGSAFSSVALSKELNTNLFLKPIVDQAPTSHSAEIAARSGNQRQVDALKKVVNTFTTSGDAQVKETVYSDFIAELNK